jgi:hypothetical protein
MEWTIQPPCPCTRDPSLRLKNGYAQDDAPPRGSVRIRFDALILRLLDC